MSSMFGNMFDDQEPSPQPPQAGGRQQKEYTRPTPQGRQPRKAGDDNLYLMPFGKYKGTAVLNLEASYLAFLWWDFEGELRDPLRANVIKGLESYNIDPEGDKPFFPKNR